MVEPYAVIAMVDQKRWRPAINSHLSFPTVISPADKDARCFPLVGIVPHYSYNKWKWYVTGELVFDGKTYVKGIDVHYNLRSGCSFDLQEWFSIIFEWGIVNINRPSVLTNGIFGQPILSIGVTYNFLKRKRCKHD